MTTDLQVFKIYSFKPTNNYWSYSTKDIIPLSQWKEVCVFINSCVCLWKTSSENVLTFKTFQSRKAYFFHSTVHPLCSTILLCVGNNVVLSNTEKHAGLCDCCGWSSDLAHDESAAESKTLLHSQAAGTNHSQLHPTWLWSFYILQHTGACGWEGK